MYFHGFLNNGDSVEVYDSGDCEIIRWEKELIIVKFYGIKVKDTFVFIKLKNQKQDSWLILRSKYGNKKITKED